MTPPQLATKLVPVTETTGPDAPAFPLWTLSPVTVGAKIPTIRTGDVLFPKSICPPPVTLRMVTRTLRVKYRDLLSVWNMNVFEARFVPCLYVNVCVIVPDG